MSKLFLIVALVLLASAAEADFAGKWIGWGSWTFKGDGVGCNPMQMQWAESKDSISIVGGYFDCDVVGMNLGNQTWVLKNGLLFDENQKQVGTYDGTFFEVDTPSPNENTSIHIKVKRDAGHIDYEEIWYNPNEKIYVIEGRMFTSGAVQ